MPTDDASEISEVRLVAAYQALAAKWNASRALLWQFPALTLTAQAFLIGAATQLKDVSPSVGILMAVAIAVVGVASIAIQYRVGRESHLDLVMLDRYESLLLAGRPDLLSHHSATMADRDARLTANFSSAHHSNYLWVFRSRGRWPDIRFRVSLTWAIMQAFVRVVGGLISVVS
jgi:hypothetical protein